MTDYVYRVVSNDGSEVWEGRGSDPFTRLASARSRASKLTKQEEQSVWYRGDDFVPTKYKVQRSEVDWKDIE